jgi:hypothetical protein
MDKESIDKLTSIEYARATEFSPIVRIYPKIPRNTICPYTGKKFKHCCGQMEQDFCDKARDTLKEHLMKLANEKENQDQKQEKSTEETKT